MKWHPAAEAFPMMSDEELADLAADIAANGLNHPVVVMPDGVGLDGRNRWRACEMANITPTTVAYEGDDPVGFVLSENVHRRHMTKGQRAMVTVKASYSSGISTTALAKTADLGQPTIAKAAVVLEHAPELVDSVIAGVTPLNEAYEAAQQRKRETDEARGQATERERQLLELQLVAPDLADLVAEERLSFNEALASAKEREQERLAHARRVSESLVEIVERAERYRSTELRRDVVLHFADPLAPSRRRVDADALQQVSDWFRELADEWKARR